MTLSKAIIINFVSGGDNGGVKHCFLHYQKALQNLSYDAIACCRKNFPLLKELQNISPNYKVSEYIRLDIPLVLNYSVKKLRKFLSQLTPQVVIVHKNIDIKIVKLSVPSNVKVIGVIHRYNKSYIDYADAVICVSDGVTKFIKQFTRHDQPVFTLHNPVDLFDPEPSKFEFHDEVTIGTMGLFRRTKNIGELITVSKILKEKNIKYKTIIAGRRKRMEYFYKLQTFLDKTQDVIEFRPWVKDKINFFNSIDIFCLNSTSEAFGMVLTEAMARKKIVVSTDCDGPKEIITHGVDGFIVNKKSPEMFSQIIEDIISGKYNLELIAENAYKRAKQMDLETFQKSLGEILYQIEK